MNSLIHSISYDTDLEIPAEPHVSVASGRRATTGARLTVETPSGLSERMKSMRGALGNGVKATGRWLVIGTFKMIRSSIFGDEDDDRKSYPATARGRADRNFDQWLDARERWRREE
ncbi:MAG: hypothetical protein AAFV88_15575 [Planctomycetota bacterium]